MLSEQAAGQAAAAVVAERDVIQANLLELDGSFVKQLLDGATLTGQTRERWQSASATLTGLWETFMAYSAVVDRVAELAAVRRPSKKELAELDGLLTAACVQLPGASVPLARRDLAATGQVAVTLKAAVATMRRAFPQVTDVTSAVEAIWADVGAPLDAAAAELAALPLPGDGPRRRARGGVPRRAVQPGFAAGRGERRPARAPARRPDRHVGRRAAAGGGRPRSPPGSARSTGCAARRSAGSTGCGPRPPPPSRPARTRSRRGTAARSGSPRCRRCRPDIAEPPLASLAALAAAGRWTRLQAELDRCDSELAAAVARTRGVENSVAELLDRREELRGLLGAYKAKAARLGAAEDPELTARYDQAHDLLWTAPCDLTAAAAAVAGYQRAILTTEGRRP